MGEARARYTSQRIENPLQVAVITVPATTANLGPGFDCLGLALGLHNRVRMALDGSGLAVEIYGEGSDVLPRDGSNLVVQAAQAVFERVGFAAEGLVVQQENLIPIGSGLGSSAAAVMGGIAAANALAGFPLTDEEMLELAVAKENHPDNVTPALFGGLTVTNSVDGKLLVEHMLMPPMSVAIILPEFDLPTAAARAALPLNIPMADAVFNIGRMGMLIPALLKPDFDKLGFAMQDRLHQSYRLPLIPGMAAAFEAARAAGAKAVTLSGAGPSLAAFATEGHDAIIEAAQAAFAANGLESRAWTLPVDNSGIQIAIN